MKVELTVIVPVYNTAPYLRECLDSLRDQTFKDYEVWLIDDGSTDGSSTICDEYVKADQRFQVVHKENGGVSNARNLGITKAKGKYLSFVDSDDTLLPTCIEHLMAMTAVGSEIVIAGYGGVRGTHHIKENVTLIGNDMKEYFIRNNIFSQSGPCQKIFLTSILKKKGIRFPEEVHMGEDMVFFGNYMNCVESATLINSNEYIVRSHSDSLSTKYYSYESERKCFDLWHKEISRFVDGTYRSAVEKEEMIWLTRTLGTFLRTLECLYKANTDLTFVDKLKILNSISDNNIDAFLKYYKPKNFSSVIMKFLIKFKLYALFLILGTIHYKK